MSFVRTLAAGFAFFALLPNASGTGSQITPINKGEPAPFTGDLFPVGDSIRYAMEIADCAERARLKIEHKDRLHSIQLTKVQALADAAVDAERQRADFAVRRLDEALVWYRSPTFVAVVSVATTIGLVMVTTAAIRAANGEGNNGG